ncbi:hypothetical protein J4E85_002852 [Alternaria conjuncta]|uniref:uncharacterized protein n=1 Tax=Alternaria conjuncta TaxID=181017 RepID=UPI00221F978D|nr:uncharacterized protein J4E85_002852 [Alternaria conjuncta]KAI4932454.1 hypothetical protein J4E85_002852 [Alternaria conjuncta]
MLLRNDKSYNGIFDPLQSLTTTACTSQYSGNPSPLARLPRELRDQIYEYALGADMMRILSFGETKIIMLPIYAPGRVYCDQEDGLPMWMLSSKTILSEALEVFHRTQCFEHIDLAPYAQWKLSPTRRNPLVLNQNIRHVKLNEPLEVVGNSFPLPSSWHPGYNDTFLKCLALWNPPELDVRCEVFSNNPEGPRMDPSQVPKWHSKVPVRNPDVRDRFKQLRGRCRSMSVEIKVPHGFQENGKLLDNARAWAEPKLEHKRQYFADLCQSIEAWARELVGGSTRFLLKNENDGRSNWKNGTPPGKYFRAICEAQRLG